MKETPRRHLIEAKTVEQPPKPSLKEVARVLYRAMANSPALMLTIGGGVALHFILGAAAFDQLWYVEERGFERAEIARYTGWIGIVGGILGNLVGGLGGDWFLKKTGMGRPMFLFWVMLVLAPINLVYRIVPGDSWWFWIGVFMGFFQLGSFYGPTFSTVQELVPPQIRATVVAFYLLTLNLVGVGIGITLGGITIDALIAADVAEPYSVTLIAFTLLSFLAIPLFFAAGRFYERDRERLRITMEADGP